VAVTDFERRRAGLTRAAVINEALRLWVAKRQYEDAVRRDQVGYERHPVRAEEFASILEAQKWSPLTKNTPG